MKGLFIRNQVFLLQTVWIQKGPKTWFLTIILLLTLALLPTLAMAAPSLSPPAPQSWGEKGAAPQGWGERGAAARQNPTVRIEPAESVVGAGQVFTVSVMIDQADDLGGFEFTLLFVPTTVTVDSVTVGDFPASTGRTVIPVGPTSDNQVGRVSFGAVTVPPDAPGASGTGVLATVTLTAQGFGESPLDLQGVVVLDTHAGHETPTVEDGVIRAGFVVYLPLVMKEW